MDKIIETVKKIIHALEKNDLFVTDTSEDLCLDDPSYIEFMTDGGNEYTITIVEDHERDQWVNEMKVDDDGGNRPDFELRRLMTETFGAPTYTMDKPEWKVSNFQDGPVLIVVGETDRSISIYHDYDKVGR